MGDSDLTEYVRGEMPLSQGGLGLGSVAVSAEPLAEGLCPPAAGQGRDK